MSSVHPSIADRRATIADVAVEEIDLLLTMLDMVQPRTAGEAKKIIAERGRLQSARQRIKMRIASDAEVRRFIQARGR